VVESGQATFQLGDETFVVGGGHVVVGPPDVPHGFSNTGTGELGLTAIHAAARFDTEWLAGPDRVWRRNRGNEAAPVGAYQKSSLMLSRSFGPPMSR